MPKLNLNDPVVPGISAAGFTIGDSLSDMEQILTLAPIIDLKTSINFNKELANSQGWILTPSRIDEANNYSTSLYYKN